MSASLGMARQFANLMNEQQEIEQHHQCQLHNVGARRRRLMQFADAGDDFQNEADAKSGMIGPPKHPPQPGIQMVRGAEYFADHQSPPDRNKPGNVSDDSSVPRGWLICPQAPDLNRPCLSKTPLFGGDSDGLFLLDTVEKLAR
jgi:hypothetical protein